MVCVSVIFAPGYSTPSRNQGDKIAFDCLSRPGDSSENVQVSSDGTKSDTSRVSATSRVSRAISSLSVPGSESER
jgi:hypothetical protein